jgi:hypothetical protein
VETAYAEGGVDMTANVILLHLDETTSLGPGDTVTDTSGLGNDGSILNEAFDPVPGPFAGGFEDTGDAAVVFDAAAVAPRQSDFTWALWTLVEDTCPSVGITYVAFDSPSDLPEAPSVWMACVSPTYGPCSAGGDGRLVMYVGADHLLDRIIVCGESDIADGQWHHLAGVKEGHDDAEVRVYVDGVLDNSASGSLAGSIEVVGDLEMTMGGQSDATFGATGAYDEFAVWHRALSDQEIASLYDRGAQQLAVRVRSCAEIDCSDGGEFQGPALDAIPFLDPPTALMPETAIDLPTPDGRAFQYELTVDRSRMAASPALQRVTVTGRTTGGE